MNNNNNNNAKTYKNLIDNQKAPDLEDLDYDDLIKIQDRVKLILKTRIGSHKFKVGDKVEFIAGKIKGLVGVITKVKRKKCLVNVIDTGAKWDCYMTNLKPIIQKKSIEEMKLEEDINPCGCGGCGDCDNFMNRNNPHYRCEEMGECIVNGEDCMKKCLAVDIGCDCECKKCIEFKDCDIVNKGYRMCMDKYKDDNSSWCAECILLSKIKRVNN